MTYGKFSAALLSLSLVGLMTGGAQASAAATENDPFVMVIDAGRLGVMMDQSRQILGIPETSPTDSTATFAVLKSAVMSYQQLKPIACARGRVAQVQCADTWQPVWTGEADDAVMPDTVLRARIDEAGEHIMGLWSALCDTLPKDHDPALCQLE